MTDQAQVQPIETELAPIATPEVPVSETPEVSVEVPQVEVEPVETPVVEEVVIEAPVVVEESIVLPENAGAAEDLESITELAAEKEAVVLSAYNCDLCAGTGLQDIYTLCPNCQGTGKV